MNDIRSKFSTKFEPLQNFCNNEYQLSWRGRFGFNQYMPKKHQRFRLKLFLICATSDFNQYSGAQTEVQVDSKFGFAVSAVNTLIELYLWRGHHIFVNSYYATLIPFVYLQLNGLRACGTVRTNRKGVPQLPAVNSGEVSACRNNIIFLKGSAK